MENTAQGTKAIDGVWRSAPLPERDRPEVYRRGSNADYNFGYRLITGMIIRNEAEFGGLPPSACLEA